MELSDADLRAVPDAGILYELPNGIRVLRRKKHEPIDLSKSPERDWARLTDKVNGAKFLPGTTLRRIVELTVQVLVENNAEPGKSIDCRKVFDRPIGISMGRPVRGLRVFRSQKSKDAHAVPVDENRI